MKISTMLTLVTVVVSTSCHATQRTPEEMTRFKNNTVELNKSPKTAAIFCTEDYTWTAGALAGTTVFDFVQYDPKTGSLTYTGHWGSSALAHPERQKGIIAGVTKFLSVTGQGVWNTESAHPSEAFVDGAGGISFSIGAFPLHHPASQVMISAFDGDSRPIEVLSSNAERAGHLKTQDRSQSDLIDFPWKTIEEHDLGRAGARIEIKVTGESEVRTFFVPAEVFRESIAVFKQLMTKLRSDSKDYMYKCEVTHPQVIID